MPATTTLSGFRLYDDVTGPGGTPLYSWATGTDANENRDEIIGAKIFDDILTLPAGAYKFVQTYGSAAVGIGQTFEDTASFPDMTAAMVNGMGLCAGVVDDGAGGWTVDPGLLPSLRLLMDDFPVRNKPGPTFGLGI
jgi:hypothetical protein